MTIQEPMPCVLLGHVCKLHAIVSVEPLELCATVEISSGGPIMLSEECYMLLPMS